MGTAVIRLADAELLPYEFTNLADTVTRYVNDLQSLLKQRQNDIREHNRQVDDGVFAAVRDPKQPFVLPEKEKLPPAINFAPLENAASALTAAADRYRRAVDAARPALSAHADVVASVNRQLIQSERALTDPAGLPGRSWYRHLLYAPGTYTGYGVKTMPGVREGIEQARYEDAEHEAVRIANALERETALLNAAASDLERIQQSRRARQPFFVARNFAHRLRCAAAMRSRASGESCRFRRRCILLRGAG
jgi:N-acetylated-alpha-linked acidic dipeptidase